MYGKYVCTKNPETDLHKAPQEEFHKALFRDAPIEMLGEASWCFKKHTYSSFPGKHQRASQSSCKVLQEALGASLGSFFRLLSLEDSLGAGMSDSVNVCEGQSECYI